MAVTRAGDHAELISRASYIVDQALGSPPADVDVPAALRSAVVRRVALAWLLLALVWGGALAGIAFRVFWLHAPRWLYTPTYMVLGWAAIGFAPGFLASGQPWAIAMAATGGVLYTIGGVIYGIRRPDPSPRWFGFHEIFHALTVAAFATHAVGVGLAAHAAGA